MVPRVLPASTLILGGDVGGGKGSSPQGPGLLCSISSSEFVICRILSYRLGGEFLSSVLGKEERDGVPWAGRRASPLL